MHDLFETHPEIANRFPDLHPPFLKQAAVLEANRCLNCFDAPCTTACPTHIDVPRFIKKIASGNLRGSALGILEANVLASSCARVCPVQVLCEGSCVMHHAQEAPIAIGRLQRYAMDAFDAVGGQIPRRFTIRYPEKIACLGAGPASLAAAAELSQRGFAVTVYDRKKLPGGLNTYGVAEYKLSTKDSLREIERIEELGVIFSCGIDLDDEPVLSYIEDHYHAIFLGIGLGAIHKLNIPGADHPAVVDALTFIEKYKLGQTTRVKGHVVVIGAGNTAIDAAIAARRLGAKSVRVLHRRSKENISAFEFEYQHAQQEGVVFEWNTQPVAVKAKGSRIESLECATVQVNDMGVLMPVKDSHFNIACDLVVPAIGQSPLLALLSKLRGVRSERGRVVIERSTGQTTHPKYFAGGDCANGGREVVDAVADGKRAGAAIAKMLGQVRVG